jgi:hypothetical protein
MTNKEIFNLVYPTPQKQIIYWEKRAKEQLQKDGYYSKKVAMYGNEASKLKLKINNHEKINKLNK